MLKFTSARYLNNIWLILKKISGTNKWEVAEDFIFYIDYENRDWLVIIPKWFITDMWSIPRILWIFLNPTKYISYVLHDFICSRIPKYWTRKQADIILIEWMNIEWASFFEKLFVYLWVRIWAFFWIWNPKKYWHD